MIAFFFLMLPTIVRETRLSFLARALFGLLLSFNVFVQFQMVVGESSSSAFLLSRPSRTFVIRSKGELGQRSTLPVFHHQVANTDAPTSLRMASNHNDEMQRNQRRDLFALAIIASIPLQAHADNSLDVDWGAFGASLQQPSTFQAPPPSSSGGADLNKALQDSAKRKAIDPRTHG